MTLNTPALTRKDNSMSIYHVGLLQHRNTAVFQFRRSVDELSCEILQYFGERQTTKADARKRLAETKAQALAQVQADYPHRGFKSIRLD